MILAIDPGSTESAYVILDRGEPIEFQKIHNGELLDRLRHAPRSLTRWQHITHVAIEWIASYGMPVGKDVFDTCLMVGRIIEAWPLEHTFVYRREVKAHLCNSVRAKDSNVRTALLDRFGGKSIALGTKKEPGKLRGLTADCWAALGVAITYSETHAARSAA
jgi:hypothetical protein